MREQTQYTTMVPNYQIITSQPTCRPPFTLQRSARPRGQPHQPTTAHRPMQAIQCTTAAAPLSSSESRESGRGRWWRWRNRLPACGNTRLVEPLPAQPLVRSQTGEGARALSHTRVPLASAQLFPTPGYPLPALNARAILPTALATARHPPDGASYGAAPAYSARYGAPSAYSAERSAPSTSASSAMRTYMPFSISIK